MNDIHFKGEVELLSMVETTRTSDEVFHEAFELHAKEVADEVNKRVEKELQKKYAKGKGKPIKATIYCTMCTQHFEIKRKNNKSDATAQQICPHTILKTWEVVHSE
jgi:hypothetical protein